MSKMRREEIYRWEAKGNKNLNERAYDVDGQTVRQRIDYAIRLLAAHQIITKSERAKAVRRFAKITDGSPIDSDEPIGKVESIEFTKEGITAVLIRTETES